MIEKHTSIFRALQSNQGVAATPPPPIQVEIDELILILFLPLFGEGWVAATPWLPWSALKIKVCFLIMQISISWGQAHSAPKMGVKAENSLSPPKPP